MTTKYQGVEVTVRTKYGVESRGPGPRLPEPTFLIPGCGEFRGLTWSGIPVTFSVDIPVVLEWIWPR